MANKNNPDRFGNHDLRLSIGDESVAGTVGVRDLVAATGEEEFVSVRSSLGRIRIAKEGEQTLRVIAERIDTTAFRGLKLQAIELTPA